MITDPIFYRLFATSPETFFQMLGMSADLAADTAARYQFKALEFKETSHRVDGVFLPKEAGLPIYFLEAQFYLLPSVYAGLLAKVYTYLKQHDPGQSYCGVVLFSNRGLEPEPAELEPYQPLLDAGVIRPFFLEEMPELANAPRSPCVILQQPPKLLRMRASGVRSGARHTGRSHPEEFRRLLQNHARI